MLSLDSEGYSALFISLKRISNIGDGMAALCQRACGRSLSESRNWAVARELDRATTMSAKRRIGLPITFLAWTPRLTCCKNGKAARSIEQLLLASVGAEHALVNEETSRQPAIFSASRPRRDRRNGRRTGCASLVVEMRIQQEDARHGSH